ncbi:tubulin monoglycylase TTLL3-like [Xenopus tropicalis]|uniref:Tubulin monoglycylase TTLL3-like n=1 Tax=Xenopus tropicalis TaxID=8364 RepID=A0A8J1JH64_XENTR|nr:tubulin monoglycylase TTLL3-like [Xenopus tropicalis]
MFDALVKKTIPVAPKKTRSTREIVETAIKEKKIFSMSGCYPVLRNCLQRRGWVEKTICRKVTDANKLVDPDGNLRFKARLLFNVDPNFFWIPRADAMNYDLLSEDQIINHFQNAKCFTTKAGLCTLLDSMCWFADVDPYSFVPRCYRLRQKDERQEFIDDFIQTAARGILKWVSDSNIPDYPCDNTQPGQKRWIGKQSHTEWLSERTTPQPTVKPDIILKAIDICKTYLDKLEHKDIDKELPKPKPPVFWKEFLRDYERVIHDGATIENATLYATRCHSLLHTLEAVCPQIDIEGERNIWIIKPGAKSRGIGIICKNNLEDIMSLLDRDPVIPNDDFCVVQKYIERPLLIHGTKFDVRQWFLVTDWNPLTIWFYKRCYLRFSSQIFSLKNLNRSVHLCNNAVQKYCKNSPARHPDLPDENMWHDYQLKHYLKLIGAFHAWDDIMLPGMKEIIIQTMKSAQDKVVHRKNTFHLYGADFMFGENFQPWLIEINASPALSKATSVSSKLSAQVQEDILRLILDRREDSKCDVGDFELLYQQVCI